MITLFHNPMSAGSRTVRLLLTEYEIDVTFQEERAWERREEFLQMNPAATLPVLVDGGNTIVGAHTICEYAPDSQALRAARTNIKYHLKYFGWLAQTRDWMAGDRMTNADLAIASSLSLLDYLGEIDWAEDADLKDWYARMKSRPSFRPLLADRLRGMPPVSHYVD